MIKKGFHTNNLDDLVFDKLNKEYGAYLLRKKYPRSVWQTVIWVNFTALILAFLLFGISQFEFKRSYNNSAITVVYDYSSFINQLKNPEDDMSGEEMASEQQNNVPQVVPDSLAARKRLNDETANNDKIDTSGKKGKGIGGYGMGDDSVYVFLEKVPEFPGGNHKLYPYISKNLKYPWNALAFKIQGTVHVCFVINTLGETTNIKITRGVHPSLDSAVVALIQNMPRWKPGYQHQRPVKALVQIPITFKLPI